MDALRKFCDVLCEQVLADSRATKQEDSWVKDDSGTTFQGYSIVQFLLPLLLPRIQRSSPRISFSWLDQEEKNADSSSSSLGAEHRCRSCDGQPNP